ncbi:integrase catalytic domain-containing protein [Trichonephila clavipes]|nr:integrase catalytic domain-containing protein [Trichonephila clavipes]
MPISNDSYEEAWQKLLDSGKIVGSKNEPIAQRTMFGWVVAGKLNVKNKEPHELYSHFLSTENELNIDSLLQRFWETEELSVKKQFLSDEEQFCENHFKSNFKYNDEGRFVVKLPIYRDTSRLGNTKGIAISRLLAMERRFQVDTDFERQYKNFMVEYESLGHMMPVENNEKSMDPKIYFLPHHAVMKGDSVSTKLRVVFDGTCKPSNRNSINSILGIAHCVERIKDSPIREYKLCTVTYGTASAPYLATRCLFETGLDLERDDPAVSSLIKESFYIDDLMAGAPSSEEAISLIKTLSNILEARGFHLRKWRSNSSEVLSRISSNWVGDSSNLEIHPDECSKALGLTWNSMKDIFIFNLKVNFPDNITKRSFLSQSARLFDPLGFLTPCTVSIKIFYQQLWLLKLDWDSPLPEALATNWKTFQKEFEQVCSIHIPRWIHTTSQQIILHGFCDASELAYASVIYAVQPQADGNTKVTLLVAKSRVAPLKSVSIPRLELNGALLLARLYATCKNILKEYDVHFYAWTDSQVVLSWLSSHPRNWKPYIANRTSEILDLVPADSWRYVPTKMNPADIACRGLSPKELPTCVLWWEGPQWLSCEMDSWPKQPKRNDQTSYVSKERKRTAFSFPVAVNCDFIDYLFLKFSSFTKIIDIFAFCFRYITNCKARVGKMKNLDSKGKYHVPPLTTYERRQATLHLELVSDLTSEAFIASLKRFCARRGAPKHIYCDNGTTFVGARRKLLEIFKFVSKLNENEQFCYFLSQMNIEWHFSPPVSPHFGGLWEAGVKSIKYHLKRVIGNTNLTFEEFSTLLTQVEAILNSRPLVSLECDNDPDSLNILTPSHFLIGEVITSSPEHTNDDKLSLRSRWDIVQKMKLGFWRKWKMDYLSNLQNRTKWKSPNHNFKVGEIVIIKEDNIPPATWPLGKVIETHPGKDGVVRVVTLRTVKGRFKRPIHKLCKLPLHQE